MALEGGITYGYGYVNNLINNSRAQPGRIRLEEKLRYQPSRLEEPGMAPVYKYKSKK